MTAAILAALSLQPSAFGALQQETPTVNFQMIRETRRHYIGGHVKAVPKRLEPLLDQWVTMSGFAIPSGDGEGARGVIIAENQYDPVRHYGTPPDAFNSVSVVFRKPTSSKAPYLQVSGYLRFLKVGRRESDREQLVRLYHITEAVEGSVANPDARSAVATPQGSITFALLESAAEPSKGGQVSIPEPVRRLESRWVTITGHVLLGAWDSEEISQFGLAKNPWDGCCMGVPPGLFDSLRVTMAPGKKYSSRFARVATISGKFRIEVKKTDTGYLEGVYWLDDAVEGAAPDPNPPKEAAPGSPAEAPAMPVWPAAIAVLMGAALIYMLRRGKT
jgi:hypothetical protein